MSILIELIKSIIFGIIEGITEWLPVSSTGHMILAWQLFPFHMRPEFTDMFLVLVQLGAIMAVVTLYWKKLLPFSLEGKKLKPDFHIFSLWLKIIIGTLPAALVGIFFDDVCNRLFYNYQTVSVMLILFGIVFLFVESKYFERKKTGPSQGCSTAEITCKKALFIGLFQMLAAIFPGTSRSGATIIGALIAGIDRTTATEFTFYLAIPAMAGASLLKLMKFGLNFSTLEFWTLILGMSVSYLVSILSIEFLTSYVKHHNFKLFGYYRIVLGCGVLFYFSLAA